MENGRIKLIESEFVLTGRLRRRWKYLERLLCTVLIWQSATARSGLGTSRRVECFENDATYCADSICTEMIYANRWCRADTIATMNQIFSTSA